MNINKKYTEYKYGYGVWDTFNSAMLSPAEISMGSMISYVLFPISAPYSTFDDIVDGSPLSIGDKKERKAEFERRFDEVVSQMSEIEREQFGSLLISKLFDQDITLKHNICTTKINDETLKLSGNVCMKIIEKDEVELDKFLSSASIKNLELFKRQLVTLAQICGKFKKKDDEFFKNDKFVFRVIDKYGEKFDPSYSKSFYEGMKALLEVFDTKIFNSDRQTPLSICIEFINRGIYEKEYSDLGLEMILNRGIFCKEEVEDILSCRKFVEIPTVMYALIKEWGPKSDDEFIDQIFNRSLRDLCHCANVGITKDYDFSSIRFALAVKPEYYSTIPNGLLLIPEVAKVLLQETKSAITRIGLSDEKRATALRQTIGTKLDSVVSGVNKKESKSNHNTKK